MIRSLVVRRALRCSYVCVNLCWQCCFRQCDMKMARHRSKTEKWFVINFCKEKQRLGKEI